MAPDPDRTRRELSSGRIIPLNKALTRALCLLGGAGILAGMFLENNALFLSGIALGVLGYLGVRKELKRAQKREEEDDTHEGQG